MAKFDFVYDETTNTSQLCDQKGNVIASGLTYGDVVDLALLVSDWDSYLTEKSFEL